MTLFQYIFVPLLTLAGLRDLLLLLRAQRRRGMLLVRMLVWFSAAVAVAMPTLTSAIAGTLGIGRGSDLILYGFVLGFVVVAFFLYSRCLALERQITELVRKDAIEHATYGAGVMPEGSTRE